VTEESADHPPTQSSGSIAELPEDLKQEIRSVLSYMDQLLEALPDDKIEEFAQSEHFVVYKRLFEELGLET
jgi:pilus assembly protein FimV